MKKARAFCRGMLSGAPLVEVACRGLMEDIPEGMQEKYAERLRPSIGAERACDLLSHGIGSEAAQEALASVISERGDDTQAFHLLINRKVGERAQEILAGKITDGLSAYILLKCRTITSHDAEEALARALKESGLSERAAELLLEGNLLSDRAKLHVSHIADGDHRIIARLLVHEGIPHEARVVISKRMPPACSPFETEAD